MGYYINLGCPKCKYSFSGGYRRSGVNSNLGLPYIKCPQCQTLCKTGNKIYSTMDSGEKSTYIFSRIGQALINGIAISLILLLIAISIKIIDEDKMKIYPDLILLGILGICISLFLEYFIDKSHISKLEKAYRNKDKDYYANID